MRIRRQLAVASPIDGRSLVRAAPAVLGGGDAPVRLAARLCQRFGAAHAVGTDSGTSALVLALRLALPTGSAVALPAYACVDLVAAVRAAGAPVRLYDVIPETLGPDLASLEHVLRRGVAAVVVAHLYGYPVDVPAVAALARAHGAIVIDDAAQGAAGTLGGRPLGSLGDLGVLSFGRGKGITGGGGGALLAFAEPLAARSREIEGRLAGGGGGGGDLARLAAQWLFGRPSLYALPAAIPALHLGETVYHVAREPRRISTAAARVTIDALAGADAARALRRANAEALGATLTPDDVRWIRVIDRAVPGFLRLPVRDLADRQPVPAHGILRAYPRPLRDEPELRPCLLPDQESLPGAEALSRTLFTLPVHGMVSARDLHAIRQWLGMRTAQPVLASEYVG